MSDENDCGFPFGFTSSWNVQA